MGGDRGLRGRNGKTDEEIARDGAQIGGRLREMVI